MGGGGSVQQQTWGRCARGEGEREAAGLSSEEAALTLWKQEVKPGRSSTPASRTRRAYSLYNRPQIVADTFENCCEDYMTDFMVVKSREEVAGQPRP